MKKIVCMVTVFALVLTGCSSAANTKTLSSDQDFYTYATADLETAHPIDAQQAALTGDELEGGGWAPIMEVRKKINEDEAALIVSLRDKTQDAKSLGVEESILHQFITLATDKKGREAQGAAPLQLAMDKLAACTDAQSTWKAAFEIYRDEGYPVFINLKSYNDQAAAKYYPNLAVNYNSLRDSAEEDVYAACLAERKKLFIQVYQALGFNPEEAAKRTDAVFALEEKAAQIRKVVQAEPADDTDVLHAADLEGAFPNLHLTETLKTLGIHEISEVYFESKENMAVLDKMMIDENTFALQSWLLYNFAANCGRWMTDSLAETTRALSDFEVKTMGMQVATEPLDSDCLHKDTEDITDDEMITILKTEFTEELAGAYANEHLTEDMVKDVTAVAQDVIDWYSQQISTADWLSEQAKESAGRKIKEILIKVGKPEVNAYHNAAQTDLTHLLFSGKRAILEQEMQMINDPNYYRMKWKQASYADTANASYMPEANFIFIPTGIMQAPFYDSKASKAENAGGLFFIVAHEISHAFDPRGSKYDEYGRMVDTWTPEDHTAYNARTNMLVEFYRQWECIPGLVQDTTLTLPENCADQGAIQFLMDYLDTDEEKKDALEHFAQCWFEAHPDTYYKAIQNSRNHSFGRSRVNGTVAAADDFYRLYNVKQGDTMYVAPEKRPHIWG